ncbi:MAG TPA: DHHA1 domain-containing protein, partial [Methanobacterium sp.]
IDKLKSEIASLKIDGITSQTETVGELVVLNQRIEADMGELVKIASNLTETQGKADVVVIVNSKGKIAGAASPKALKKGVKINELSKKLQT